MWLRGPSPIANSLESRLHSSGDSDMITEWVKDVLTSEGSQEIVPGPPPVFYRIQSSVFLHNDQQARARDESYPQYPVIFTHHTSQALELAKLPSSKALSGHSKTLSTCEYAYTSNVLICMCICLYRLYSYTLRYERLHRHYTRHTYIHACIPTYHYLPTYVHTYVYICIHTHRYYRCGL